METTFPPAGRHFDGRVLFLSQDADVVQRQLAGDYLTLEQAMPLRDGASLEQIAPAGSLKRGVFAVAVAGQRCGQCASRDAAPYAELLAGIGLVIARSFDPGYRRNCHNLGVLTSTDFGLVERIRNGEAIPLAEFTRGEDPVTAQVIRSGGLFAFTRARLTDESVAAAPAGHRPMTYAEKILSRSRAGRRSPVRPGDTLLARADWRHADRDLSPIAQRLLELEIGPELKLHDPKTIVRGGTDDSHVEPGQLVIVNGSHAPRCGALGALAFPVGAIDMVCAWMSGEVRVTVPPTCRVRLDAELAPGVAARDIVTYLLALPYVREGLAAGQVIEYSGEALLALPASERTVLIQMAVAIGAFCGIVAPDAGTLALLRERHGPAMALDPWMRSDPDAEFAHTIVVDCSALASGRQVPVDERRHFGGERPAHRMGPPGDHLQPGIGQQAGEALSDRHRTDRVGVAP